MRIRLSLLMIFTICGNLFAQEATVPNYYESDPGLSEKLMDIVKDLGLDKDFNVGEDGTEQISLAVIDLNGEKPKLGGVNYDNFIYPASVYKIYVGAEILHQITSENLHLDDPYVVQSPNDVDKNKEIQNDPRALLKEGDSVTVNYLLDLMITRSDNTASNCLIDLAQRPKINTLMHHYNWQGSEVTRKFLSRKFEDPEYVKAEGTMTCALHAADFMYKVQTNQLVNPWVSMQMKVLLGRQLDKSKLAAGLPDNAMFYHKTGWWSYWTNDVGIVDDGETSYIIACFLPIKEELVLPQMKELSKRIYNLMKSRS
ncbi:serine hydrolase [Gelidibacter gilvus]|uniref:beta-lactamase n=1 Tax=Gelidibacter gilvus TaxID=59602 RepID=A0A4Q0XMW8_9FLAO|nr:serine hydrolase [Gelidibacter gilvus]RXJ52606.1 serine hydrolase [Gelidibacter gilvus]